MRTVLVIDDEAPTLSMFSMLLEFMGYVVLTADNGPKGLELFKTHRPSIVFTDIKMPDMDGLTVLARIKGTTPNAEVVIITGHGDVELALNALNLGATDFIDKPIRQEALTSALSRAEERLDRKDGSREQVVVTELPGATVVAIRGKLAASAEGQLTDAQNRAAQRQEAVLLSFDVSATLSGAGIALITQLLLENARQDRPTAMAAVQPARKVLEMAGLQKLARIYDTEAQALSALGAAPS